MRRYEDELKFWRDLFSTESDKKSIWLENLIRPETRHLCVPKVFKDILKKRDWGNIPKVLDVGCGPISCLQSFQDSGIIELTGIDPLTLAYAELLKLRNISMPCNIQGNGEEADRQFPINHFDIVMMRNSLDHTADPFACIKAMNKVLKIGGLFAIEGKKNEGIISNWSGLHLWNLNLENQVLICESQQGEVKNLLMEIPFTYITQFELIGPEWFSGVWMKAVK